MLIGALVALREGLPSPRAKVLGALAMILAVSAAGLMTAMTQAERENEDGIAVADDARLALWPVVVEHIKECPLIG